MTDTIESPAIRNRQTLGIPSRETTAAQHYLRDAAGAYLHFSGEGVATEKAWRWRGSPAQAKALREAHPFARRFQSLVPA